MSRIIEDPRLLAGLSPSTFLARHWQKKPLLVRGALDVPPSLPDRDALFTFASRDDVESRLVTAFDGRWTIDQGPFDRLPRARRDWTLLVQGVNLVDRTADALMRRFDFVSTLRLDDCMMSYAVDGGGVGPHVDSYDVFLLQVAGRRRWRWSRRTDTNPRLVAGAPLKLVAEFAPTDDAVLEPGDMLYLPPHCAHEGVAIGPCITASIGFRAPAWDELVREFLVDAGDRVMGQGRYRDRGRRATRTPSEIDDAFVDEVMARVARVRFTRADVVDFVGRWFSDPKAHVFFDPPDARSRSAFARDARRVGLVADRRATLLYRRGAAFVAGERFDVPASARRAVAQLANRRRLDASDVIAAMRDDALAALLHRWWQHGWIHLDRGARDERT